MTTTPFTKAFTIVETLVAISVLMIAIAGPLVVASRGLTSAVYSKNQMTAAYLAQESMEVIKNRRDNNKAHNGPGGWLEDMEFCQGPNAGGNFCDAGMANPSGLQIIEGCGDNPGCSLIFDPNSGYVHDVPGIKGAVFSRYFYLEDKGINNSVQEYLVHVFVNWKEGTIPFQIHLTSTLLDVIR